MWLFVSLLLPIVLSQQEISFQPDRDFRRIGAAIVDEGRLTKEVIPAQTFTDPNGYTIDYYLLRYDSKRPTAELVEQTYEDMRFDNTNWRWNDREMVYIFPIRLPDQAKRAYNVGRRTKNTALLFARNGKGGSSVTKVRTTVTAYDLTEAKEFSQLEVTLREENNLQDAIRRLVELIVGQTETKLAQWRVIEVKHGDEQDQYKVLMTLDDNVEREVKCDTSDLGLAWARLTGLSDYSGSGGSLSEFSERFMRAAQAENVELEWVRTIPGSGCALPPPPMVPRPTPEAPSLPEGPIAMSFTAGNDQTLDLTSGGTVEFNHFSVISSDLDGFERFIKVEGASIRVAMPTQYRSFSLTIAVGNGISAAGELEYIFTDAFNVGSNEKPEATIAFTVKDINQWSYETSATALRKFEKATEAGFSWYELNDNVMVFAIPENLKECSELGAQVSWLQEYKNNLVLDVLGLIGTDGSDFEIEESADVKCEKKQISTTSTTSTSSTTTSTTTTTTSTTTTTTTTKQPKTPSKPKCHRAFSGSTGKIKAKTIQVDNNVMNKFTPEKLFETLTNRAKLNQGAKLEISKVEPVTTAISHFEDGTINVMSTDASVLPIISGTPKKGVVLTVTLTNVAANCEGDEIKVKLTIEPKKREKINGCDLDNRVTHNHEFEVIMTSNLPNNEMAQTIIDEYQVMAIIRDTYQDSDMSNIFLISFGETEAKDKDGNVEMANKLVWGNATLYSCEKVCPREEIHTLTNKLVTQAPGGKDTQWVVESHFHSKFKDTFYELKTVSARGIHACQQPAGNSEKAGPAEAGMNKKVVVLVVVSIGALAVIIGCCWMRQNKSPNEHSQGTIRKVKSGVPTIMADESEGNPLVPNTSNGTEKPLSPEQDGLPPKPVHPEDEHKYSEPPSDNQYSLPPIRNDSSNDSLPPVDRKELTQPSVQKMAEITKT